MRRQRDSSPGPLAWLIALVSLMLPWAGAACIGLGAWRVAQEGRSGAWWLLAGVALLALDVVIDFVWAHPRRMPSDQPDLNRRSDQLVGRVLVLAEAIEGGRGKVRCGDTLWQVEGPDLPQGTHVRVVASTGMLLRVEPL